MIFITSEIPTRHQKQVATQKQTGNPLMFVYEHYVNKSSKSLSDMNLGLLRCVLGPTVKVAGVLLGLQFRDK